jgi:hypothetical protein
MRQIDLSQFAPYDNDPPAPAPPPDPDSNAAIVDGTLAQAFNNDFIVRQQALLHDGPEAFYAKRGADALVATPDVLGNLKTLRDQFVGTTVNARQRQILADALDNHLTVSRADIARHADLQQRVWQNTIAQDRLDLLHKQAGFSYDDPDSVANYADAGRSAALHQADLAGFAPEEADTHTSNAASAIWRSAIEAALAKDATRPAIALHARAADTLSLSDAAILAPQIEGAREREIGRAYLAKVPMPENDPAKPLDHAQVLAALETTHAAATDRNTSDWPDNDSQRATNQHFIDVAFGQKKRDAVEAKVNLDRSVDDWLKKVSSDGQPQTNRPPLPIWASLTADDQQRIDDVIKQNANPAPDRRQSEPQERPDPKPAAADSSLAHKMVQITVDALPGAYYSRLALEAFRADNYATAAGYGVASFLDAFIGVATLGYGTEIGAITRSAIGATQRAAEGILHESATALGKAAALVTGKIKRPPSGAFSIIDWTGYPEGIPKPTGPFRLLEEHEYDPARTAANNANRRIRRAASSLKGKEVHEIHPVKFGGDPTDPTNKMILPKEEHLDLTLWWARFQHWLEKSK